MQVEKVVKVTKVKVTLDSEEEAKGLRDELITVREVLPLGFVADMLDQLIGQLTNAFVA
jgi:hypothetical protein